MKIIDVSKHNGVIDWKKVKASGIDGVIIRAGYGREISQIDKTFESFYAGAKSAGLLVGSYWYSYAITAAEAEKEAGVFLQAISGKKFELPVYFDIEEQKHVALGKAVCTDMVATFCSTLENAGYFAGVYSFDSFFSSNLESYIQDKYSCWVARVENIKPTYCKKYDMHQYSWRGKVNGINGDVDLNNCTKDFETIIKRNGMNGFNCLASQKYNITARVANLGKTQADSVVDKCKALGMSVVIEKE